MKRIILLMAFACLTVWAKGQSANASQIAIGRLDTVNSTILGEKRPVWVYCPPYDSTYFTKPAYPVLYVFDGDGNFAQLVTMVQHLSQINGNTLVPQMIIVGIRNLQGTRTRDLTPTNSAMDKASGGGEKFTQFLEKELIPYIDNNYPTAAYRTLIGHSLGGLMAVNTLINHTNLFNAYIAIDPSMFYDDAKLLRQTDAVLHQKDFKGRSLFVGIANTMNLGMDTVQVRTDTTQITRHIRAILKLKDNLQKYPSNNLRWSDKYYADDDHSSVPLTAEYDGLRFIFNHNKFPGNQPQNQFYDKSLSPAKLKEMFLAHYKLLSTEMGYTVRPEESSLNFYGYLFLQEKDYGRSQLFFGLNIYYYPNSFNVYDSMGDSYLAMGNKTEAISYFKKALAIKFRADIKEKLDKLL